MSIVYRRITRYADKFVPERFQPFWNHQAGNVNIWHFCRKKYVIVLLFEDSLWKLPYKTATLNRCSFPISRKIYYFTFLIFFFFIQNIPRWKRYLFVDSIFVLIIALLVFSSKLRVWWKNNKCSLLYYTL